MAAVNEPKGKQGYLEEWPSQVKAAHLWDILVSFPSFSRSQNSHHCNAVDFRTGLEETKSDFRQERVGEPETFASFDARGV